jgi:small-conductance mechanosensitive channel
MKKNSIIFTRFSIALLSLVLVVSVKGQDSSDTTNQMSIKPIELVDIAFELGKVEKTFNAMELELKPNKQLRVMDSILTRYENFLEGEANDFKGFNPNNLSKFFLESSYRLWEGYLKNLNGWEAQFTGEVKSAQDNINKLKTIIDLWTLTLNSEEIKEEPEEFKQRLRQTIEKAKQLRDKFREKRRELVLMENRITDLVNFTNQIISEIVSLQQHKRDSLFFSTKPGLWQVKVDQSDVSNLGSRFKKFSYENAKSLYLYFRLQNFKPIILIALIIIIVFYLLRHAYFKRGFDDSVKGHKNIMRIFEGHPILTLIALILVMFHLISPFYPLLVNYFITISILVIMRYILSAFIGKYIRSFINVLILLYIVNILEIVFWYFGDLGRFYILAESLLGMALIYRFIKPALLKKFSSANWTSKATYILALFSFVLYFSASFSNLFGYVEISIALLKVAIRVPEFSIVLYGIYKILAAVIMALASIGRTSRNQLLIDYWDRIEKRGLQIIAILAVFYWIKSFTISLDVSREFFDAINSFLTSERNIGTLQITIGSILAMILILLITFVIAGLLKVLIENVILKKSKLPRGVPAAISVTIRYFLIVLGFIMALSAAGIELGKFSLLAGALGVGIGFGLQNIVNNFISGLILVYERPLNVGDTIEVENLLGQVNRIGIRSSNVKTYDGAEVVVPNGNLISNQLINWTLSDNKRRIEIKVGVAYGSDPNVVVELLEKVARENEEVMKDPAPWALFEEFGDSSLNFRLLFWVPYDIGIGTKSKVAIGIYNIFKENNIEIPFPQIDLHLKDKPSKEKEE